MSCLIADGIPWRAASRSRCSHLGAGFLGVLVSHLASSPGFLTLLSLLALLQGLAQFSALRSLSLYSNHITDVGVCELAAAAAKQAPCPSRPPPRRVREGGWRASSP